jgi:hypothetical protein
MKSMFLFGAALAAVLGPAVTAQNLLANGHLDLVQPVEVDPGFFQPKPSIWVNEGFRAISGPFENELSSESWAGPPPTPVTNGGLANPPPYNAPDYGVFFKPFNGNNAPNGPVTGHLYQDVPGGAGAYYKLTAWAGAEANAMMSGAVLAIEFRTDAGALIEAVELDLLPTLNLANGEFFNYKQYTLVGLSPAGTGKVRARVSMLGGTSNPMGGGQIFVVDDLVLTFTQGSDDCEAPQPITGYGAFPFNTVSADTDGSPSVACTFFGDSNINSDVWFCWTAPTSGWVTIDTCVSNFDTKLAVYEGCDGPCPVDPLGCSDDGGCGPSNTASRLLLEVHEGLDYRIRVGGYEDAVGSGLLEIGSACTGGSVASCCQVHLGQGCGDEACCAAICFVDSFCCDGSWDELCVQQAAFHPACPCDVPSSCQTSTASCTEIHAGPGCADSDCCAAVCDSESSCCESGWDWFCVEAALTACDTPCEGPAVSGATATVHSGVVDPIQIALAPDATLYCGRDDIGSGGSNTSPVKIHRAPAGGGPSVEWGAVAIPDPDAVVVDVAGTLSGVPGSVLVGGQTDASGTTGQILAVRPDQSVVTVFAPSTLWKDPQDMVFDGEKLLVADRIRREIRRWMPGQATLSLLVDDLPEDPTHIGVDQGGRIFVSLLDGTIRRYSANGSGEVVVASGLPPLTPIAIGPTGPWQTGAVYAVVNQELVRFDPDGGGAPVVVGCGFTGTTRDLAFGPDRALYVSRFGNDHVMRFLRPTLGAVPGDLDCNGLATTADVAILCDAVEDPAAYAATYPLCALWPAGDLNGDGAIDAGDVAALCALLGETPCGCFVPGDLNQDGQVNGADLGILLGAWASAGPLGDLNGDMIVDGSDLGILLGAWTG